MVLTRRHFLTRAAAAGGASLLYEAMAGLGLLAMPAQTRFELQGRVSGARVFTVRRGTVSEEDGPGQTASFDDGLYFNAGPMRISHHHSTTLAYCRELQVPVETFVADTDAAYLYQTRSPTVAGRRIRLREARADFDGYIAELLSKALSQAPLDQPLTVEDRDRLLAYLRQLGALDRERQYRGSPRRNGYSQPSAPLSLHDLLGGNFNFQLGIDWDSADHDASGRRDGPPARGARRAGGQPRRIWRGRARDPAG